MSYRCCCIPVRLGVLVLSPVVLTVSVLLTVLQFRLVFDDGMGAAMSELSKALMGAFISLSLLVILGSILGWFGAVLRKRRLVVFFGVALWLNLLFLFGIGIAAWVFRDQTARAEKQRCTRNVYDAAEGTTLSTMQLARAYCRGAYDRTLAIAIMAWILLLLVLFGLCLITTRYSAQLRNEAKVLELRSEAEESFSAPHPAPAVGDDPFVERKTLPLRSARH